MAEVVLFHHAQGLTAGVLAFTEALRAAGHVVHTPDLYEGRTFDDLDEGVAHAESVGFRTITERGRAAAAGLPAGLVYLGFSLGAMPAQALGQNRAGAKGVVLLHGCAPLPAFGEAWPAGVPLQLHAMDADEWAVAEVKELAEQVPDAELFWYPGDRHLFTDSSLPAYDAGATALVKERVLRLLEGIQ